MHPHIHTHITRSKRNKGSHSVLNMQYAISLRFWLGIHEFVYRADHGQK